MLGYYPTYFEHIFLYPISFILPFYKMLPCPKQSMHIFYIKFHAVLFLCFMFY